MRAPPHKSGNTMPTNGAADLPNVIVESYNAEIADAAGFIGDRVNKGAFSRMVEEMRAVARRSQHDDPLGAKSTDKLNKTDLDAFLESSDAEARAVIHGAIETFAQAFAGVINRFMQLKGWRDTQAICVGGGFRRSRIGELAIARAELILAEQSRLRLMPIANHPDDAGLIGGAYLLPAWMIGSSDAIVAVDIGGTNIRAGIVQFRTDKRGSLVKPKVAKRRMWRHADCKSLKREQVMDELAKMVRQLVDKDASGLHLAPLVAVGCPGLIDESGTIERGAHNLPGNWHSSRFNLPNEICARVPAIGGHATHAILHNDAVVQGLSEIPRMADYERWSILTIGTGLGNAHFVNK